MPTNLYGIGDNFDLNSSHVIPALIRKFHQAKISKKKREVQRISRNINIQCVFYFNWNAERTCPFSIHFVPKSGFTSLHFNVASNCI